VRKAEQFVYDLSLEAIRVTHPWDDPTKKGIVAWQKLDPILLGCVRAVELLHTIRTDEISWSYSSVHAIPTRAPAGTIR
jgi:hypothetical protein